MLLVILIIFSLAAAGFGLLFRILLLRSRSGAFDPLEWLDDFSPASYRPMERLLDNRDYAFLSSQKGYEASIGRSLRRERIGVFQTYLGGMVRDFHRLLRVARFITVYATQDQMVFEAALWRLRWSFYRNVAAVEIQVALHWAGLGTVDARRLVESLEQIENYTQKLIPAAA